MSIPLKRWDDGSQYDSKIIYANAIYSLRVSRCLCVSLNFLPFHQLTSLPLSLFVMTSPYAALIQQEIFTIPSFTLESGAELRDVPVAYKTWGKLNGTRDNVMLICHAFTGSSDVEDW